MSEARIVDELYINAPLAKVWRVIEDRDAHARWHPFVTEIRGLPQPGQVRTCSVAVGMKPGQTIERCVEHESGRHIVWAIENDSPASVAFYLLSFVTALQAAVNPCAGPVDPAASALKTSVSVPLTPVCLKVRLPFQCAAAPVPPMIFIEPVATR